MIPADLAARLRMLTEASFFKDEPNVQELARVRPIQERLPDLLPGQRFMAMVQRALPDGTFEALVAGRNYTLALNHPAKAGDTLELVVTRSTPRAVFAQLADPAAGEAARPNLSPTGRLIGVLLTGQPAGAPAALAGGKPLLDAPPATAAALAPALREALARSGLFYESHQAHWLAGKVATSALLGEPQGRQSGGASQAGGNPAAGTAPGLPQTVAQESAARDIAYRPGSESGAAHRATDRSPIAALTAAGPDAEESAEENLRAASSSPAGPGRTTPIPERLLPVVHQQLEALATQNYVLHGQAWPGQHFEWEIEDPEREHQGGGDEAMEWNTTLRLTLPRLGGIEARLHLTPAGIALRLLADEPDTVAALQDAKAALDEALAAADLPLTGFVAEPRDAA